MIDFAIPLLRATALLTESHFNPLLNHLSELSVALTVGAASLTTTEECCVFSCTETGGCWGFEYCPDGNCHGAGCGVDCRPVSGACDSGGQCWVTASGGTCCDCRCCPPGMPCFYCICPGGPCTPCQGLLAAPGGM
jgi:hypothetical protein